MSTNLWKIGNIGPDKLCKSTDDYILKIKVLFKRMVIRVIQKKYPEWLVKKGWPAKVSSQSRHNLLLNAKGSEMYTIDVQIEWNAKWISLVQLSFYLSFCLLCIFINVIFQCSVFLFYVWIFLWAELIVTNEALVQGWCLDLSNFAPNVRLADFKATILGLTAANVN